MSDKKIENNVEMQIQIHFEEECKLTNEQKTIIKVVYDSAKKFGDDILNHPSLSEAMKITQLIGNIMKLLENLTINGVKLNGSTKKTISLELGRILIRDLIKDDSIKNVILPIYDSIAETLLETLVDVSQHINTAVKDATISCCESLLSCLKK